MTGIFAATVAQLTDPEVRERNEVGYYEGFDGDPWLAVDADTAAMPAAGTRWVLADLIWFRVNATKGLFDVANKVFSLDADHPIVLRAATR